MNTEKELVWCIPINVFNLFRFNGFNEDKKGIIYKYLIEFGEFKERDKVEQDPSWIQIIPQALVVYNNKILVNKRLKKQTETRLHDKFSLSIGGHLNPEDNFYPHLDIIQMGLFREVSEEIILDIPFSTKYMGLVYDDSSEVSKVHLGVWFLLTPISDTIEINEKDKMEAFFSNIEELENFKDNFESWANIIYTHYIKNNLGGI